MAPVPVCLAMLFSIFRSAQRAVPQIPAHMLALELIQQIVVAFIRLQKQTQRLPSSLASKEASAVKRAKILLNFGRIEK